jgi:hypothetical protein
MVIVTFTDTLATIDKAKGPDYTTKAANYKVAKTSASGETKLEVKNATKGADDKTVTLAITGVLTSLTAADSIKVELIGLDKPATYTPSAPTVLNATATSGTTIGIKFSDGVQLAGTVATTQFTVTGTGVTFAVTSVELDPKDPQTVIVAGSAATGVAPGVTDLKIKYTPETDNKITSITGLAGLDVGKFENQTVSIQFPLTAAAAGTAATGFTLTFSEALFDGKTALATGSDVTAFFDKAGTGTITSATVDASNAKIIAFVIAGAVKDDKVIPNAAKTVMTQGGIPWKQIVTWDEAAWAASAP